jgi:hypothetical protein
MKIIDSDSHKVLFNIVRLFSSLRAFATMIKRRIFLKRKILPPMKRGGGRRNVNRRIFLSSTAAFTPNESNEEYAMACLVFLVPVYLFADSSTMCLPPQLRQLVRTYATYDS